MVEIKLTETLTNNEVFTLNITDRLSIVAGDSGQGKTTLCGYIQNAVDNKGTFSIKATDMNTGDILDVYFFNNARDFETEYTKQETDNSVFILDDHAITVKKKEKGTRRVKDISNTQLSDMSLLGNRKKYILAFDRDLIPHVEVGLHSIFDIELQKGVYKFIPTRSLLDRGKAPDFSAVNYIVFEDSKSGYQIFQKYFGNLPRLELITCKSNSRVPKVVKKLMEKDATTIAFLDYDVAGKYLHRILENSKAIINTSKGRVVFVENENFEAILCFSDFISRILNESEVDQIQNYEKYLNIRYRHRGDYFLDKLEQIMNDSGAGRYAKGRVDCFTNDCNNCEKTQCRLRMTDAEDLKRITLFAGKYDDLNRLYDSLAAREEE